MQTRIAAGRVYNYSHTIGSWRSEGTDGFHLPIDLALDKHQNLYVLSRGSEYMGIPRVTVCTTGNGAQQDEKFLLEFGSAGEGDGQFAWPSGIALDDEENVYVSDEWLHRVSIFDKKGKFLAKWGDPGSAAGQLNAPSGLAFDTYGNVYVSDAQNSRIQKFTPDGKFLLKWGRPGNGQDGLNQPWGLTVDHDGHVMVADWGNNRVRKFSPEGDLIRTYGLCSHLSEKDSKPRKSFDHVLGLASHPTRQRLGQLYRPSSVALDKDGDVYVADWGNDRVHVFDPDGSLVTTFIGDAEALSKWGRDRLYTNESYLKAWKRAKSPELQWRFARPTSIVIDNEARIIITDTLRFRLQIYQKERDYVAPQFNL
jgi:tripartite motif-containing protein 71